MAYTNVRRECEGVFGTDRFGNEVALECPHSRRGYHGACGCDHCYRNCRERESRFCDRSDRCIRRDPTGEISECCGCPHRRGNW